MDLVVCVYSKNNYRRTGHEERGWSMGGVSEMRQKGR